MKRRPSKPSAKNIVLPHTQAKLDLYKNYLLHYLRVLSFSDFCNKINLYDVFCGSGIYDDGNIGSPLITNNCINEIVGELTLAGRSLPKMSVVVNDKNRDKVENVRDYLLANKISGCEYKFYTEDAAKVLDIAAKEINKRHTTERNLLFIDPYGYSDIDKEMLLSLLKNDTTEIMLFLPVNQMYRFTETALTDKDRKCYEDLRRFVSSFFPIGHKIHTIGINDNLEYINAVKDAISFNGKYYTCSHYIEREKGSYYAVFFITPNLYGLEKMVEAKWKLDPTKGRGHNVVSVEKRNPLFVDFFNDEDKSSSLSLLREKVLTILREEKMGLSNCDLYKFALINEFLPQHMNKVLYELVNERRVVLLPQHNYVKGFYIDYKHHKNNTVKAVYKSAKWHRVA